MDSVSLVIPCFNKGESLISCARSVARISDEFNEVVFVNDCGVDGSFDRLKTTFKNEKNFIFIENSSNIGPLLSRKVGVENCTSHWVGFLDADDIVHEECKELISKIKNSFICQEVSVVYGVSSRNLTICLRDKLIKNNRKYQSSLSWFFIKKPNMSNFFVRKIDFLSCQIFEEKVSWGEDIFLFFEIMSKGCFEKYPLEVSEYRVYLGERGGNRDISVRVSLLKKCGKLIFNKKRFFDYPYFIYFSFRSLLASFINR